MGEYKVVPPPAALSSAPPSFEDAIKRAKEIAARLTQDAAGKDSHSNDAHDSQYHHDKRSRKRNSEDESSLTEDLDHANKKPHVDGKTDNRRPGLGAGEECEEMIIPTLQAGAIMGPNNSNAKSLEAQSGAKLELVSEEGSAESKLILSGSRRNLSFLKSLIEDILKPNSSHAAHHNSNSNASYPPSNDGFSSYNTQPGQLHVTLMIAATKIGLIIGKGGEKIKELQARSGARIQVIQTGLQPGAPEKPVEISGDSYTVQVAQEMISALIDESQQNTNQFGNTAPDGSLFKEIIVPRGAVGLIIGRGGETIKRIQVETGCHVQLSPDMGGPDRTVNLKGLEHTVQYAEQKVNAILEEYRNRQLTGGVPSTGASLTAFQQQIPGSQTVAVRVLKDKVGLIIGRGGDTIRWIQQQSGAFVQLNRNVTDEGTEKEFTVCGLPQQIQYAQQLMVEKTGLQPTVTPIYTPSSTSGYGAYDQQYGQYAAYSSYPYQAYGQNAWYGNYPQAGDKTEPASKSDDPAEASSEHPAKAAEDAPPAELAANGDAQAADYSAWYQAQGEAAADPAAYQAWYAAQGWYGYPQSGYYGGYGYDASGATANAPAEETSESKE